MGLQAQLRANGICAMKRAVDAGRYWTYCAYRKAVWQHYPIHCVPAGRIPKKKTCVKLLFLIGNTEEIARALLTHYINLELIKRPNGPVQSESQTFSRPQDHGPRRA